MQIEPIVWFQINIEQNFRSNSYVRGSMIVRSFDRSNYLHFLQPQSSVTYFHVNNKWDFMFLENIKSNIHSKVPHMRPCLSLLSICDRNVSREKRERGEPLGRGAPERRDTSATALPSVFHSPDRLAAARTISGYRSAYFDTFSGWT